MAERFGLHLEDGPYPGEYIFPKDQTWPLPEEIPAINKKKERLPDGKYVKFWQSEGTPKNKKELRGAKYRWKTSKTAEKPEKENPPGYM